MKLKAILALSALVAFSAAADRQSGTISGYNPYQSGDKKIMFFSLEGATSEGCNVTGRFAIDDTNANYEHLAQSIQAAYHSESPVTVAFTKSCNTWGNAYDSQFICVGNIAC